MPHQLRTENCAQQQIPTSRSGEGLGVSTKGGLGEGPGIVTVVQCHPNLLVNTLLKAVVGLMPQCERWIPRSPLGGRVPCAEHMYEVKAY